MLPLFIKRISAVFDEDAGGWVGEEQGIGWRRTRDEELECGGWRYER